MLKKFILHIILFFISLNIFSQNLNDTVVEITKIDIFGQRIFKKDYAGMKSTYIDTTILKEKIDLSLSDVLSQNSSVFIKKHGRGALATASFRGTAASHTQVSWNGININSPMSGMVDFSLIPVFIIDDLELNHGTASIVDNSGGLGGSINISSSAQWDKKFSAKYIQAIGSFSTYNEFLQLNGAKNKISFKTRLYHNFSLNNFTFINRGIANIDTISGEITNPLDTNDNADYAIFGGLQEFYFRPNSNNLLSVKWWGQKADRTIPRATSYEGPDNSNRNNQTDIGNKIVFDWKYYGKNDKLKLQNGFSHKKILYVLLNTVHGYGSVPAVYSKSKQNSFLNEISYSYNFPYNFSLKTSLKADFHYVNTKDTVKKTGYKRNRREFSYFFSLNKSFLNKLNLKFMLRQDLVDNKFVPIVPFIGFDYKFFENHNFLIKGNFARNYHQPNLNDLYWQPGGNSALKPEKGISCELGLEESFCFKKHNFSGQITAYYSDIKNWIIWIPSYKGFWQAQNIKNVISKGIEFSVGLKGNFKKLNYSFMGTYAYTSSKNYGDSLVWGDNSYGKQLVYVPLHSGNIMSSFSYKKFYITFQHNSYSERFTTSSNDISKRDWLYPYFMNDLIIGKNFNFNNLKISTEFKIYNLFNETYHSALYRPMPKRNYLLMFMIKF